MMVPLPDEETFLPFWDSLAHDVAMFASKHPDRIQRTAEEEEEERESVAWMGAAFEAMKRGEPLPPREPVPEPLFTVDSLPYCYRELHERAAAHPALASLFRAYRAGLTQDATRTFAAVDVATYHDAMEVQQRWYREVLSQS